MKRIKTITALVIAAIMLTILAGCGSSNDGIKPGSEFTLGDNTYLYQSVEKSGDIVNVTLFVKGDGSIRIGGGLGGSLSIIIPVDMVLGDNDSTAIRPERVSLDSNGGTETHKLSMVFEFDTTGVQELTSVAKVTDKENTSASAILDISSVGSAGSSSSSGDPSAVIMILVLLVVAGLIAFAVVKTKKKKGEPAPDADIVAFPEEETPTAAGSVSSEPVFAEVPQPTSAEATQPAPAEASQPTPETAADQKVYSESDNMGTRHDSMDQATAYWMGERFMNPVKPPFTMYTMPSAESAEEAFLSLPFMHKASDSGKLICDRLMTFGLYETTLNGVPTGEYEAMITGSDLTLDEYNTLESAFEARGGRLKNHDAPDESVKASEEEGDAGKVVYSETVKGNDGISTYEVYTGPDKASAMAFLKTRPVTQRLYYIVVDTPEGSFGRDISGFYQE